MPIQVGSSLVPKWRHNMETFSVLLTFYERNAPVTGGFLSQRTSNAELVFSVVRLRMLLKRIELSPIWDAMVLWRHCIKSHTIHENSWYFHHCCWGLYMCIIFVGHSLGTRLFPNYLLNSLPMIIHFLIRRLITRIYKVLEAQIGCWLCWIALKVDRCHRVYPMNYVHGFGVLCFVLVALWTSLNAWSAHTAGFLIWQWGNNMIK